MFIQTETVSDPDVMRFLPGRRVLPFGQATFDDSQTSPRSALARRLFAVDGVLGVTLESDAVAVRKRSEVEWHVLKPPIFGVIMDHFADDAAPDAAPDTAGPAEDGRLAVEVAALLDERIRPALAENGGDIVLHGMDGADASFEIRGGAYGVPRFVVEVRIENTLRHYLPEIGKVRFVALPYTPGGDMASERHEDDSPAAAAVRRLLEEDVNPAIASHGGRIALVDVRDGTAYVRLEGGCQGCGMSDITLRQGVEMVIRTSIPEITEVLDVTDHDAGTDPYYRPDE